MTNGSIGGLDEYQGNPIGYGSAVINSQLVNVPPLAAYNPLVFAGAYSGPAWPRQGVYDVPPVMPSSEQTFGQVGGAAATFPTATDEQGSPYSVKKSPVWWALGFLAAALLFLHYVVYK